MIFKKPLIVGVELTACFATEAVNAPLPVDPGPHVVEANPKFGGVSLYLDL